MMQESGMQIRPIRTADKTPVIAQEIPARIPPPNHKMSWKTNDCIDW
jgi:hypothetical protein